jgi:Amt family ammonium transporter
MESIVNELWITFTAVMMILLLLGRSMLEVGLLKPKFSRHVAAKNIFQLVISCFCFFAMGHALSSDALGGFYGQKQFLAIGYSKEDFSNWVLVFIACWHCVSVASCSLAERTRTGIHNAMAAFVSCFVFPVVASWSWGDGWLAKLNFVDVAGSGSIHLVGGTIGLVGTLFLGPRLGLFNTEHMIGTGRSLSLCRERDAEIKMRLLHLEKIQSELRIYDSKKTAIFTDLHEER